MKKLSLFLAIVMLLSMVLSACGDKNPQASGNPEPAGPSDPQVTLADKLYSLLIGETYQISYTVEPAGTPVVYIPSDTSIISVDANGLVTGLKTGTATVAVSAGEYSRAYIDFNVTAPAAASIPEVILASDSLEMIVDSQFDLSAYVRNGSQIMEGVELTWSAADSSVVSVQDGKVTALATGETEIIVSAQVNGKEIQTVCPVAVYDFYNISIDIGAQDVPVGATITFNTTILDKDGQVVTPEAGELEYISSDPDAIKVNGSSFKVVATSQRTPSVGVRYKGNVASVPVEIFNVTADFFQSSTIPYTGEVAGVSFSGVLFSSSSYQPYLYFSQDGLDRLNAYAQEHGYTTLRLHAYPIQRNNMFCINNEMWLALNKWSTYDIPLSKLTTSYFFWSQSEGLTENYMWFELL